MARTLIGQLILRLRAEGLGEAKNVVTTMKDIENAARNIGRTGVGSWGAGFGKQLAQLKATPGEIEAVRRSWTDLVIHLDNKNVAKALRKQSISAWKTSTISHLAAVRAEAEATERRVVAMHRALGWGVKPAMVMGGGYTMGYMGGIMGREALIAASNERRVQAEAKYAGLSLDERGKIDTRANELATRYRLAKSQIYDVMKEASLSMPSTDAAITVSDEMARAYLVLSNMLGPEGALAGLRQFNKALDNIERITPEEYRYGIKNFMKAQQVIGRDIDPAAFAEAIKFARAGGKVFGDEFMFQWLPMLIAESGGSDSGTQLRAAFDQFIVGRASKEAIAAQDEYGIREGVVRNKNGKIVDKGRLLNQEKFTDNPLTWMWDTLLPKLREKGVDLNDTTELARIVGQLTNNRLSSDLILRAILSMQQYRRLVEERLPNAAGLDAADSIQTDNPFAAWAGFKDSLENLSAAVLPMGHVSTALNTLADGINTLTAAARENPALTALGMGAAGVGAFKGGKGIYDLLSGGFGLKSSAIALDGSAAALTRAAAALGGQSALDGGILPDGKPGNKPGGGGGLWGWMAGLVAAAPGTLAAIIAGSINLGQSDLVKTDEEKARWDDVKTRIAEHFRQKEEEAASQRSRAEARPSEQDTVEADRERSLDAYLDGPSRPTGPVPLMLDLETARADAQHAASDLSSALSIKGTADIDSSAIDTAIRKAQVLLDTLRQAGSAVLAAGSSTDNLNAELRRSMSDFQVAP